MQGHLVSIFGGVSLILGAIFPVTSAAQTLEHSGVPSTAASTPAPSLAPIDRLAVALLGVHADPAPEALEAFRPGLYEKLARIESDTSRPRLARIRALGAMAREDQVRALPRVLELAANREAPIRLRLAAAWTLGHPLAGRPEAIPALEGLLADRDPGLRERAVLSLAKIGTPRALELLEAQRLVERHVIVRTALRELAAKQRGLPVEALRREGHTLSPRIRPHTPDPSISSSSGGLPETAANQEVER